MDGRRRGGRGLSLGGGWGLWRGRMCRGGRRGDWLAGRIGRSETVSSKHQRLSGHRGQELTPIVHTANLRRSQSVTILNKVQ
jgi:hypothetical protein